MMLKWNSKKLSYEEYYEKKHRKSNRIWILIVLLLFMTAIVLGMGISRSNERKAQILEEAEQYYAEPVGKGSQ